MKTLEISATRKRIILNGEWEASYQKHDCIDELLNQDLNSVSFVKTMVPEYRCDPGYNMAIYRKTFILDPLDYKKRYVLHIGAAMLHCEVFLNKRRIGSHSGGYTPFEFDISTCLKPGKNELVVYLQGDSYGLDEINATAEYPVSVCSKMLRGIKLDAWKKHTGLEKAPDRLGIWQDVYIDVTDFCYSDDVYIVTDPLEKTIELSLNIVTANKDRNGLNVKTTITELDGKVVYERDFAVKIPDGGNLLLKLEDVNIKTWSPEDVNLYYMKVRIYDGERLVDENVQRFGFRKIEIRDGYFYLNGKKVILRGEGNFYRNRGYQFDHPFAREIAAFHNKKYIKQHLEVMKKELDINFMRIHGAIGHSAIFEAADEVGIMVENQSSVWSRGSMWYLKAGERFLRNAEVEFGEWIKRDRNHPSVILWGVENEMLRGGETPAQILARREFYLKLDKFILTHDKTRPLVHAGAVGAVDELEVYHIHNEENYNTILKCWRKDKPIIFGEFWIGGRAAERRLTDGDEYFSFEDYKEKEYRLWTEKIEPMRKYRASGFTPFNFTSHLYKPIPVVKNEYSEEDIYGTKLPFSEPFMNISEDVPRFDLNQECVKTFRHLLGRYFVTFWDPNPYIYLDDEGIGTFKVFICNDSMKDGKFTLEILRNGKATGYMELEINAGGHCIRECSIFVDKDYSKEEITLDLKADGLLLDRKIRDIFFYRKTLRKINIRRKVFVIADKFTGSYESFLKGHGISYTLLDPASVNTVCEASILILSSDTAEKIPELKTLAEEKSLRILVVEGQNPLKNFLGLVDILTMKQTLPISEHFEPIVGRKLTADDVYHTCHAVLESTMHPVLSSLPSKYVMPMGDDSRISLGVMVYPGCKPLDMVNDLKDLGAGEVERYETNVETSGRLDARFIFKSLIGGSRREYSVLAELAGTKSRILINRLKLSEFLGMNPFADMLLENILIYLDLDPEESRCKKTVCFINLADPGSGTDVGNHSASCIIQQEGVVCSDTEPDIYVFYNLEKHDFNKISCHDKWIRGIRVKQYEENTDPKVLPPHVAFKQCGYFSSSKNAYNLEKNEGWSSLLMPEETVEVAGGFVILEIDQYYQAAGVNDGIFFPRAFYSGYPKLMGYECLEYSVDGKTIIAFAGDIYNEDGTIKKRYENIFDNINRCMKN